MKKFLFVPATVVALLFAFNAAIASADEKKEGAESKAGSVEEQMDNLRQARTRHPQHQEGRQGAGAKPRRRRPVEDQHRPRRNQREGSGTKAGRAERQGRVREVAR